MDKSGILHTIGTRRLDFESKDIKDNFVNDFDKNLSKFTDENLVELALKGFKWAFEMLVQNYYKQVYRIAYRILNDHEDALDATQEVFIRVYNSLSNFEKKSSFKTWIYKIAVNTCLTYNNVINKIKKIAWEKIFHWLPLLKFIEPSNYVVEKEYKSYLYDKILQKISSLPEVYKIPVILKDIEGISIEEIAEILDIPEGTVKSRLNRGRRILQEELEDLISSEDN